MKVTITSIELKGPLKFFILSREALKVIRQLRTTNHKAFKKAGFWTRHYTMTLWESDKELGDFSLSGAHLKAMKRSREIAKEIRILTYESDRLPSWPEAKEKLKSARVLKY